VTGAAAASYEWAVSVDGEDWEVVETETDETFAVTADLVGMYVKVTVTAEDEETASDATVLPVEEADGQIEITSAEAIAANKIAVTLAEAVDTTDTVIEVTKGSNTIAVEAEWAETADSLTLTSASKLTNGTYTVTLTSEEDPTNTDSEDVEIVDQYVKEIVITTDTALTDRDDKYKAYASYDVFDQYGNSLRTSTSITWAGSCKVTGDKTTGKLTLEKTNHADNWVYNEQIYVTGVYAKTGVSVQKTLTVGSEQALDSLEIAGFVKKGTTEIVQKLPAGFKEDTYYLVFKALDQVGTQIELTEENVNDITFVSDNVLVIKEVSKELETLTIEGQEYVAALVQPGIKVADGGKVTVTAIANKTGNKTSITMNVGEDRVLKSFKLLAPAVTVADGDEVEIPFEAIGEDGLPITDFVTLAKQETFNTLSFNASEGTLKLAEQADGSAKLTWKDKTMTWADPQTTDGIDRPISLTAIVVGGDTDNEMISVSDKRRPDAVLSVDMDEVYTEGAFVTFTAHGGFDAETEDPINANFFESFQFVDQYGATIKGTKGTAKKFGDGTGFFVAANTANLVSSDTDFKNHLFGVRVTYAGSDKIGYFAGVDDDELTPTVYGNGLGTGLDNKKAVLTGTGDLTFLTAVDIESAATGEGFKFAIASINPDDANTEDTNASTWDSVSPDKFVGVAVVDLSQVKSMSIQDLNKFYLGNVTADDATTGKGKVGGDADGLATLTSDDGATVTIVDDTKGLTHDAKYKQDVVIKGSYNGKSVTIPADFYSVTGSKLAAENADGDVALGANTINAIVADGINIQDLYDKTSAQGTAKDATDTLKAKLYNIYDPKTTTTTDAIAYKVAKTGTALDTAKATLATLATGGAAATTSTADGIATAVAGLYTDKEIPAGTLVTTAYETLNAANTANAAIAEYVTGLAWSETPAADPAPAVTAEAKAEAARGALVGEIDIADALETAGTKYTLFDTLSKDVTISDQESAATKIDGLKDAYTIAPTKTKILNTTLKEKIGVTSDPVTVKVLDQYGVDVTKLADLNFRATALAESATDYAENNLTANKNDSPDLELEGAERGNTFTLVLTQGAATAETAVTVGADTLASIDSDNGNNYIKQLVPTLEQQRKNGLA